MQIFAILDKAKPGTENTRGLNLAAVRRTTVQVTMPPLYPELHKIGDDLLFSEWTDRGLINIVYIYIYIFIYIYVCVCVTNMCITCKSVYIY
jgi:hypothetical protein